ncbi:MAG: hypothetical protein HPY58_02470 [Firmicutes bacterium]|nr:hypothetical protein [Bacillota bacterium]
MAKKHNPQDALFYRQGERKEIVVAAPHHGCTPGSDYFTREIATLLASSLRANLLVAEGLRPLVDLNKDPSLAPSPELRDLCLTYQGHALANPVELFLEIHGHVRGRYDLELSCGFEFEPYHPLDKEFGEKLASLRALLPQTLSRYWKEDFPLPQPSVGLFPFDKKVVMRATKTYLFRKIRELQLKGRRIFGLHIEIYRDYKTGDPNSPIFACQEALVAALAASITRAFQLKELRVQSSRAEAASQALGQTT